MYKLIKVIPLVDSMLPIKVLDNLYWVGALDWNARHFHGLTYSTPRGTTYNSYLIVDDKITLVDGVYGPFAGEMMDRISEVVDPCKIDYVIANHVEPDHSGSIVDILKCAPDAKLVGTNRCKAGLQKHYFGNWDFQVVKTGDELILGSRTLTFLEAPMLHWPDTMFTYIEKDALLLPNDAFGQHLATSKRFDDEVERNILMGEAAKYYANIFWPFSVLMVKKIEEIQKLKLKIKMIAPSHGIIWRNDPMKIVEAYLRWAKNEVKRKVLVVYDTMWNSTEKMAKALLEGIRSENNEAMLFRLPFSDHSDIIKELLDAKGLLIGSSTFNSGMLPTLASFLRDLNGLKPKGKIAAAFGSYGWGGGATKSIEEVLKQAGMGIAMPALGVNWVPNAEEIKKCFEFGKEFAKKL